MTRATSEGAIEPWYEPIAIWHGGMSFHGGLIGVIIALLLWIYVSGCIFIFGACLCAGQAEILKRPDQLADGK